MRNIIVIFIIIFLFSMCDGIHSEHYDNGILKYEVPLLHGKYNGKARKYDKKGNLIQVSNWVNGVKEGYTIVYDTNGKIDYKALFKNGEQILIEDFDTTGILRRKIEFKDKKYNGNFFTYYENGIRESEGQYKNGISTGYWKMYYKNGNIREVMYITKGDTVYNKTHGEKVLYNKIYDINGELISSIIPVKVKITKPLTYRIELLYTDVPDVALGVLITSGFKQQSPYSVIDTLALEESDTSFVTVKLRKDPGSLIYGLLYELDGKTFESESWTWFIYDTEKNITHYKGDNTYLEYVSDSADLGKIKETFIPG